MLSCPPTLGLGGLGTGSLPALVSHRWTGAGASRRAPKSEPRVWLQMGLGAGLALAAKARYAPQPKLDPELVGLSMLNKDLVDDGEDSESFKPRDSAGEADESWAFWEEQKNPTKGAGNQPREKLAAELPSPLPSLEPPPKEDEDVMDQETSFRKAYGTEAIIMGTFGYSKDRVSQYSTFQEAVEEFGYPPFLQAALARRGFFYLTPVQQCSLTTAYLLPILKSLNEVLCRATTFP
ncbi:unnamed protein product [Cladocopium goreaui]|uniref:Folate gamma-glutamyl hydrolase n=1 Tax=Cladocopium goreaui TaxID=2562237 RepID=A0A9P1CHQ8_9DINO|nr:unnamed protein product [Cladocopium goreaui]